VILKAPRLKRGSLGGRDEAGPLSYTPAGLMR